MRTFIAINLPEEVKNYLSSLQEDISSKPNLNIKASKAKEFHITLKFLGEVNETQLENIRHNLKKIEIDAFEMKLVNLGCFPNDNDVRVIWAGIISDAGISEIMALHKKIDDATSKIKSDNKFHPHVTLFRVKSVDDKDVLKDTLSKINIKEIAFTVDSFYLYKSTLTPGGPVYEVVEEYNLSNT